MVTINDSVRIIGGMYAGRVGVVTQVRFLMPSRLWVFSIEVAGLGQLLRSEDQFERVKFNAIGGE